MLSAVIIILREVLEAGLIISVLLASSQGSSDRRWAPAGFALGLAGAAGTAAGLDSISDWADGIGQELFNAALLLAIVLLLGAYSIGTTTRRWLSPRAVFAVSTVAIACSVTREGAEIFIYVYGFADDFDSFMPVLIGGGIGLGIGASIGALLYYGLVYLPPRSAVLTVRMLILLVSGGMAAEAAMYLTQAGLLPDDAPLWDSSSLLPERSVLGQLLYALVGYEATPTLSQVAVYLGTVVLIAAGTRLMRSRPAPN